MSILLWALQVVLALHTAMGAVWKFSHSERSVPSLQAIPHGAWLSLSVLELLASVALVIPVLGHALAILAPAAAACIAAEMLVFCALHLLSSAGKHGQLVYWLVVAAISAFVAYGRFALSPL